MIRFAEHSSAEKKLATPLKSSVPKTARSFKEVSFLANLLLRTLALISQPPENFYHPIAKLLLEDHHPPCNQGAGLVDQFRIMRIQTRSSRSKDCDFSTRDHLFLVLINRLRLRCVLGKQLFVEIRNIRDAVVCCLPSVFSLFSFVMCCRWERGTYTLSWHVPHLRRE